jgi:hypothetical protein
VKTGNEGGIEDGKRRWEASLFIFLPPCLVYCRGMTKDYGITHFLLKIPTILSQLTLNLFTRYWFFNIKLTFSSLKKSLSFNITWDTSLKYLFNIAPNLSKMLNINSAKKKIIDFSLSFLQRVYET